MCNDPINPINCNDSLSTVDNQHRITIMNIKITLKILEDRQFSNRISDTVELLRTL